LGGKAARLERYRVQFADWVILLAAGLAFGILAIALTARIVAG
jgi:hypothetical protein